MNKFRWSFILVLIVAAVGIVLAQQQRTPSVEERILTLELKVEELVDLQQDVMRISDQKEGRDYIQSMNRRMNEFKRNINNIPMRVRRQFPTEDQSKGADSGQHS